jgi:transposase, IS30 family
MVDGLINTRKKTITMTNSSLTQSNRGAIDQLLKLGFSHNQIATRLGVAKSTISYELKRVTPYDPDKAQADADRKRKASGRHYALTTHLKMMIEHHLQLTWSPEEIAHEFKLCVKSIYNWLYAGLIDFDLNNLPDRNRRHKSTHEHRGHIKITQYIDKRPAVVNTRTTFGHWEVDTVLSSRGESKSCLATFAERKSRLFWAIKIPDRTGASMQIAMDKFFAIFGKSVKTITTDNGREFSRNYLFQDRYKTSFYFCHAYSPWERGTNERLNKRLRWFFPNRTNFQEVNDDQVLEAVELINNRPLKTLNWATAIQTFRDELD